MTDRYKNIRKALAMEPTPGPWQLSIETPTIIKQDLSSIGLSRGGVLIGSARAVLSKRRTLGIPAFIPNSHRNI